MASTFLWNYLCFLIYGSFWSLRCFHGRMSAFYLICSRPNVRIINCCLSSISETFLEESLSWLGISVKGRENYCQRYLGAGGIQTRLDGFECTPAGDDMK